MPSVGRVQVSPNWALGGGALGSGVAVGSGVAEGGGGVRLAVGVAEEVGTGVWVAVAVEVGGRLVAVKVMVGVAEGGTG